MESWAAFFEEGRIEIRSDTGRTVATLPRNSQSDSDAQLILASHDMMNIIGLLNQNRESLLAKTSDDEEGWLRQVLHRANLVASKLPVPQDCNGKNLSRKFMARFGGMETVLTESEVRLLTLAHPGVHLDTEEKRLAGVRLVRLGFVAANVAVSSAVTLTAKGENFLRWVEMHGWDMIKECG